MQYGKIAGVEILVPRILFGCANATMQAGRDASGLLDAALACGINAFDTARQYGESERALGRWLRGQDRAKVIVVTKGCHHDASGKRVNAAALREDLARSLGALDTGYADIYLLHRDNTDTPVGQIVEALNAHREAGRIRAFGGSNWTMERIRAANDYAQAHGLTPFTVSSPHFGLAEQVKDLWGGGCATLTGARMAGERAWYRQSGMPVLAYSSLAHGMFSGAVNGSDPEGARAVLDSFAWEGYGCPENFERLRRTQRLCEQKGCTVAQLAVAWMFTQGLNLYAILTSTDARRLQSNAAVFDIPLAPAEAAWLNLEKDAL